MGQADIWLDDDISISDTEDYCFQSGEVTVHMTSSGWWRAIEALQDWLGECPHCERKIGDPWSSATLSEAQAEHRDAPEIPEKPAIEAAGVGEEITLNPLPDKALDPAGRSEEITPTNGGAT